MVAAQFTGGCLCDAIRYRASEVPDTVCICHCTSCRRSTGAVMSGWATFRAPHFELTQGELTQFASSPGVQRGHCARCGSAITYRNAARPTEVDVTLATLDEPAVLAPTAHIWIRDKLPWVRIGDDLPQHDASLPESGT